MAARQITVFTDQTPPVRQDDYHPIAVCAASHHAEHDRHQQLVKRLSLTVS